METGKWLLHPFITTDRTAGYLVTFFQIQELLSDEWRGNGAMDFKNLRIWKQTLLSCVSYIATGQGTN
jgi:hypothetical protein